MHDKGLLAGAVAAVVLTAAAAGSGHAQPLGPQELMRRGNDSYATNCVDSAMNYYAILQKYPGWPDAQRVQRIRDRIAVCRQGSVGHSSTGWIGKAAPKGRLQRGLEAAAPRPYQAAASNAAGPAPVPVPGAMDSAPIPLPDLTESPRAQACRAYAETTLVQVQFARQCRQGGASWSGQYEDHYNWCMSAATPDLAQGEISDRGRILNECVFRW